MFFHQRLKASIPKSDRVIQFSRVPCSYYALVCGFCPSRAVVHGGPWERWRDSGHPAAGTRGCRASPGSMPQSTESRYTTPPFPQGERLSHAVGCAFAACLERKTAGQEKECGSRAFDASRTSRPRGLLPPVWGADDRRSERPRTKRKVGAAPAGRGGASDGPGVWLWLGLSEESRGLQSRKENHKTKPKTSHPPTPPKSKASTTKSATVSTAYLGLRRPLGTFYHNPGKAHRALYYLLTHMEVPRLFKLCIHPVNGLSVSNCWVVVGILRNKIENDRKNISVRECSKGKCRYVLFMSVGLCAWWGRGGRVTR